MNPAVTASLITAGTTLLGGQQAVSGSGKARRAQELENQRDRDLQREFAQNGVRWRVEDAKAAGLHPLFALTGNLSQASGSSPLPIGETSMGPALAAAGQDVGRAIRAQQTPEERMRTALELELLKANISESDARRQELLSRAARNGQDRTANGMPGTVTVNPVDPNRSVAGVPLPPDLVKVAPDEVASKSSIHPAQTAGDHASLRLFTMENGDKVLLPASGNGGIPDEIDITMIPDIIGANIRRFGAGKAVLGALYRWFGGKYDEKDLTPANKRKRANEAVDRFFRR